MKFFSRKAPEIETRDANVADEDGVLHALWSGMATGSVALTGAAALRVPAVASCVRVISEAAASLPVRIMERGEDGVETEDLDHPIGIMLRGDVNPWTSGFDLIRDMTADALTRDWGGLAYVNRIGTEVREIIRYQASMISVEYDAKTAEPAYRIEGVRRRSSEILHVRGPFDRSPLTLAAEAIGTAKIMEEHAANFFKNGAMPGSVILNKKSLGSEGALKMLKGWRAAFSGPSRSGKTAVLWDDADVKQLSLNSVDSQFLELRTFQILEICRAFRVPPTMVFELQRATWSNLEGLSREFLVYCLEPWLRVLETSMTRSLMSREERARFRIAFDRDDMTRADMSTRATVVSTLVSTEAMSPDEARSWFDMPPRPDGQGKTFKNPHITPGTPAPAPSAETTEPLPKQEPSDDA